jgi:AraC-like DNA-binding protein
MIDNKKNNDTMLHPSTFVCIGKSKKVMSIDNNRYSFNFDGVTKHYYLKDIAKSIYGYLRNRFEDNNKSYMYDQIDYKFTEFYSGAIEDKLLYILKEKITNRDIVIIMLHLGSNLSFKSIANEFGCSTDYLSQRFRGTMYNIAYLLSTINKQDEISKKDLSTRTYNILKRNGYNKDKDLEGIEYSKFISYRNAGDSSWNELVEYMNNRNIKYYRYSYDDGKDIREHFISLINRILRRYKISEDTIEDYYDILNEDIDKVLTDIHNMINDSRKK